LSPKEAFPLDTQQTVARESLSKLRQHIGKWGEMDQDDDSATFPPTGPAPQNWEESYRRGDWDFLAEIGEAPRNALVAGYVHKLVGRGRVLDVGCGEGVLLDYLDLGRIDYTGFDVSPTAVERARARAQEPSAILFVASMDEFEPSHDQRFDMIIFNESLSHSSQSIKTLYRFFNYLTSSGYVLISQFQTFKARSDAAYFTPLLKAEMAAGRLSPSHTSEVLNCDNGIRWKIYCFRTH
jgi:2-polyprenyl-3-methyl-5-hydroxy-6-metoxy-1,4-benzoquinol methylase